MVNKIRGTFKSVAVRARLGDRRKAMLQDMGHLTGGHQRRGRSVIETADVSLLEPGPQDRRHQRTRPLSSRAPVIPDAIAGRRSDPPGDREQRLTTTAKLQERPGQAGGRYFAVIKAGAATEVELKERKHRIEDAVRNAKAVVEEGTSPVVAGLLSLLLRGAVARVTRPPVPTSRRARGTAEADRAFNAGRRPGVVAEFRSVTSYRYRPNAATNEYEDSSSRPRRRPGQGHLPGVAECGVHRLCS